MCISIALLVGTAMMALSILLANLPRIRKEMEESHRSMDDRKLTEMNERITKSLRRIRFFVWFQPIFLVPALFFAISVLQDHDFAQGLISVVFVFVTAGVSTTIILSRVRTMVIEELDRRQRKSSTEEPA